VDRDGRLATLDDDERPAGCAFLGDRLAGRIGALDELGREAGEELLVRLREERDSANQFDAWAGDVADPNGI